MAVTANPASEREDRLRWQLAGLLARYFGCSIGQVFAWQLTTYELVLLEAECRYGVLKS